ncbi:MAG: hypothetical protein ACKVP0_28325 [Pirellulaceae bacterium]
MKFSIRDLMFVTVIVALAVAWWLDRSRLISQLEFIEAKLMLEKSQVEAEATTAKAIAVYEAARADFAKALAAKEEAVGSSRLPQSPNSSEGPVRGYNLLGPNLPEPHDPAKR